MVAEAAGRRLVLLRHGQTAWNKEGRAQGHADVGLDAEGRRQAEAVAPVLADLDPVRLVSSDLARARETAAFLEKATGLSAEEDPRLREYDVGQRQGLTRAEFADRLGPEAARAWDVHSHVDAAGAETLEEVAARIVPATRTVLTGLAAGETAVVVTHGASLRVAVAGLLGWPLGAAETLEAMHNCAWAAVVEHGQGRLRLSSYNTSVRTGDPDWSSVGADR